MDSKVIVFRLTALWGFSESVIGGFLHAARIPVTGLVLGGFAAIITSLIFYYSRNPRLIVSATLQVLLIKFVMSPHTPFAAYLAVMMEGLFATGIFYLLRSFSVADGLIYLYLETETVKQNEEVEVHLLPFLK